MFQRATPAVFFLPSVSQRTRLLVGSRIKNTDFRKPRLSGFSRMRKRLLSLKPKSHEPTDSGMVGGIEIDVKKNSWMTGM